MKYEELTKEQARKICKKYKCHCDTCPLRREKIDPNGKLRKLFCNFILQSLYEDMLEEVLILQKEEIKYSDDVRRVLNELITNTNDNS